MNRKGRFILIDFTLNRFAFIDVYLRLNFLPAALTREEHRKAREHKRRAECDDSRVAVGLGVSSECGAGAPAEMICKAMRYGVKSLRESWRRA